ncbi:MAG: phospholipase/carboxylesterase [Colwellia sp.]|jgi:phospholipase/carboxylesterase
MSIKPLARVTIEPKSTATSCVIWLHGLGDSGDGFAPIVPVLNLPKNHGIRFIFPHAPEQAVTINQGYVMRSWYDIKSMDLHNRADMEGVLASEKAIHVLIQQQIDSGISADKIILAGFSQGGVVSLFTGLRFSQKLAGILALSCYLPTADKLPDNCHTANKQTPILQNHGEQDDVVPMSSGVMANKLLIDAGYHATWKAYRMPHSVLPEQLSDISAWLVNTLLK